MKFLNSSVTVSLPFWRDRSPQIALVGFHPREITILSLLVWVSIETNRLREVEAPVKRKKVLKKILIKNVAAISVLKTCSFSG